MLILHGHVKYKWIGSILTLFWCIWHGHAKIHMFMPNWFPSYYKNNISSPFCTIMQKFHMFMWNWHSFDSLLCIFLQSSLPCFQIRFAHHLKYWILDFLTSKWYIACPKITSRSTPNITSKSKYMLLLEFEFQLECMNFKLYPSTLFLVFVCSPTLSITFISFSHAKNYSTFLYQKFPHASHSWSSF